MWFKKLLRSKKLFIFNIVILSIIAGLFLAIVIISSGSRDSALEQRSIASESQSSVQNAGKLEDLQYSYRQIVQKVLPVVVEIDVGDMKKQQVPQFQSPIYFFFGPQKEQQPLQEKEFKQLSLGSGVIVNRVGKKVYVLTNSHFIGEADEISIRLYDARRYKAKLVGRDPKDDLALAVFETSEEVSVAELGSSNELQNGDIVFAFGNPMGFKSYFTAGIVSVVGRKPFPKSGVPVSTDYIQTDATINQMLSGGPLVNIYGQVIGINTWISSPSGGNLGLGFTIPINKAKKAIEDFITKGKVEYGWLGVHFTDLPPQAYKDLDIEGLRGSFVYNVYKGSPADRAGILPGDYMTSVNSEPIEDATHFLFIVANLIPNRIYNFQIIREGINKRLPVKIAEKIGDSKLEQQTKNLWPGMFIINITEDIKKQLNLPKRAGQIIISQVEKGTPAAIAGLRPGDLIQSVNGQRVLSLLNFYSMFNSNSTKTIMFGIYRQGHELEIGLEH